MDLQHVPVLHAATVTLDALHNGVLWGWLVTMNMWAKSIGTGVMLVGFYMMRRHPSTSPFLKKAIPPVGLLFIGLTLFFTLLDLHQPLRFWHMFVWPNFTSAINIGAWILNAYVGVLALMFWSAWMRGPEPLFDRLVIPALVLSFAATVYTAGLMGQATARELWHTPTEVAQTLLAAGIGGSAAFLLLGGSFAEEQKQSLAHILGISAVVSLLIFAAELVYSPMRSEEAAYIVEHVLTDKLGSLFYPGLGLAFIIPSMLTWVGVKGGKPALLRPAALLALVGLWMVKHAWILAPQLLPLS